VPKGDFFQHEKSIIEAKKPIKVGKKTPLLLNMVILRSASENFPALHESKFAVYFTWVLDFSARKVG